MTKTGPPEFFCTSVRKIEPIGGDCVRVYFSIERNGVWEDRGIAEMPISMAMLAAKFLMQSAGEIFDENHLDTTKVLAH